MKGGETDITDKIIKFTIIVFMIILTISSYILIKDLLAYKKSKDSNTKLIKDVIVKDDNKESSIDWNKLNSINEDIVGWIKIENTNINYPILKDNDSLMYLKHSFDKRYNENGSIFTLNNNPFQDSITTIYGHNMRSGLMFSELGNYMKKDFFFEHSSFDIYTRGQNYKAIVFSCYSIGVYDEENNIKTLSFEDEIEYYKNKSTYSIEHIGEIKKIVKLSTCSYLNSHTVPTNQRYFIVAKLEKID